MVAENINKYQNLKKKKIEESCKVQVFNSQTTNALLCSETAGQIYEGFMVLLLSSEIHESNLFAHFIKVI